MGRGLESEPVGSYASLPLLADNPNKASVIVIIKTTSRSTSQQMKHKTLAELSTAYDFDHKQLSQVGGTSEFHLWADPDG